MIEDKILNMAAKQVANALIKYGAHRLSTMVLGSEELRALTRAFKYGLSRLVEHLTHTTDADVADHVAYIITRAISSQYSSARIAEMILNDTPAIAEDLLDAVTNGEIDEDTLPVSLEEITRELIAGVAEGLEKEAERAGSPIFNRTVLRRLRTFDVYAKTVSKERALCTSFSPLEFTSIAAMFERIDRQVMRAVRDHTYITDAEVRNIYRALLEHRLQKCDLTLATVLEGVRSPHSRKRLAETIGPPPLRVTTNTDMTTVNFTGGSARMTLRRPALIWDCCCVAPDIANSKKCPVHRKRHGSEIERRFYSGFVEFSINGQRYLWKNSDALFPPAVDAIRMMATLEKQGVFDRTVRSVLDIGCGTGFLGLHATRLLKGASRLGCTDWLLTPTLYTAINFERSDLARENPELLDLHVGLYSDSDGRLLENGPFDVALCNPPYLPVLPGSTELSMSTATFGTDLLRDVIVKKPDVGRRLFMSYSTIARKEAQEAASHAGRTLLPVGDPWVVPFRNPYVFENPDYLGSLLADGRIFVAESLPQRYMHEVQVFEIR